MSRKICVVTGSRADYGLLRWVMDAMPVGARDFWPALVRKAAESLGNTATGSTPARPSSWAR